MATLKKFDLSGKEVGTVDVSDEFVGFESHGQMIKDYIVALRENARQWSANTKGRSEVKHTTKKPYRQKGTGRARQGMLCAPQYRGGGIVFGPKPKFDQHVRINRKERRAAIHHLLAELLREGRVVVLADGQMTQPKTKTVAEFLKSQGISKRALFIGEGAYETIEGEQEQTVSVRSSKYLNLAKSLRNIPKVSFSSALNINGYDMAIAQHVVVTEEALNELVQWLQSSKKKVAA